MEVVELRYRALTHHNPGRCRVEVHEQPGQVICVVSDIEGHLGPTVTNAARSIAAAIHRELVPAGTRWTFVQRRRDGGHHVVEFAEAMGGWFARPRWVPMGDGGLAALLGEPARPVAG